MNSIQAFWADALPAADRHAVPAEPRIATFTGGVDTGCGSATSRRRAVLLPGRQDVYLDTTFFEDMLEGQLGAPGGEFAEAYVLAHEYGHHVQDLLGTMGKVRTQQGPNSDAVRLELQADCYAGIWTKHATTADDADGEPLILDLTQDDIARALDAAAPSATTGSRSRRAGRPRRVDARVGRVSGCGGSRTGFEQGTLEACDTFARGRPLRSTSPAEAGLPLACRRPHMTGARAWDPGSPGCWRASQAS